MKVVCIHVYGRNLRADAPIKVEVGGIYTVLREGETLIGFKFYELDHQPGVGYDRKCFVPLDPAIDDVENEILHDPDQAYFKFNQKINP